MFREPWNCLGWITTVLLIFIVTREGYGAKNVAEIRKIKDVLSANSWNDGSYGLDDQTIFVNGELETVKSVRQRELQEYRKKYDDRDVKSVSSAMYMALGCKCSETLMDIFVALSTWPGEENYDVDEINAELTAINRTILKSITALIGMMAKFPNVRSYEPGGVAQMFVSLNVYVNDLIEANVSDAAAANVSEQDGLTYNVRIIFQMINYIERFTISKCSMVENRTGGPPKPAAGNVYTNVRKLIEKFDALLDNTGLSTVDFLTYNINNGRSKYNKRSAEEEQQPENEALSDADGLKFNVIAHVIKRLTNILHVPELFTKTDCNNPDDIFSQQKSIFDLVMMVVYQNIINVFGKKFLFGNQIRIDRNESTDDDSDDFYYDNTELIRICERLLFKSRMMEFPLDFVNHISLISNVLRDILPSKEIYDAQVITTTLNNNKDLLMTNSNLPEKIVKGVLKKNNFIRDDEFELLTFLEKILSIRYMKNFNQIFKIVQHEFDENGNNFMYYTKALNTIEFSPVKEDKACSAITYLYAKFYKIQLAINAPKIEGIKNIFASALNDLKRLVKMTENQNMILLYADMYLGYNVMYYPKDSPIVKQLLHRMLYHTTNVMDKYQMANCKQPIYRDYRYEQYKQNPQTNDQDLKKNEPLFKDRAVAAFNAKNTVDSFDKEVLLRYINTIVFKDLTEIFRPEFDGLVPLPWKGRHVSMESINADLTTNVFDFSSVVKYVNVFLKWTTAIFFGTVLDIVQYLLNGMFNVQSFNRIVKTFDKILLVVTKFPKNYTGVIVAMANLKTTDDVITKYSKLFRIKKILLDQLQQYSVEYGSNDFSIKINNRLNKIKFAVDTLKQVWDSFYSCRFRPKINATINSNE